MQQTQEVARNLGSDFDRLSFVHCNIMDYIHQREQQPRQQEIESSPIDVLIALHACDMATDEAIFCGISSRSQIIVTAPCCHKEVRGQMDAFFSRPRDGLAEPLNDLLRYGIFREREAEMVTGVFPDI